MAVLRSATSVLVATCSLTAAPSVITTASARRSSAPASCNRFTAACVSKAKDGIRLMIPPYRDDEAPAVGSDIGRPSSDRWRAVLVTWRWRVTFYEEYRRGHSVIWYWKQVVFAIVARRSRRLLVPASSLIVGFLVNVAFVEPLFPVLHADVGPVLGMTVYRWSRAHLHPNRRDGRHGRSDGLRPGALRRIGNISGSHSWSDLFGARLLAVGQERRTHRARVVRLLVRRRVSLLVACEVIRAVCRAGWARSLAPMARLERFSSDECRNYFRHYGYSAATRS